MPKSIEVFTPNDIPTFSYVERKARKFEERLRESLSIPKMIISLSGPSKSGKTVLVKKVIDVDNLIPLSGATIRSADALWANVLSWMSAPEERVETVGSRWKADVATKAGGGLNIPFIAQAKAEVGGSTGTESFNEVNNTFKGGGLQQVVREIAGITFTVFVDEFHYIPKDAQKELGQQIKEAAESGVIIVIASVPHRADDVVRSNTALRGRVTAIDVDYWKEDELAQIAYQGFQELNMDIAPSIMQRLTTESFGSPQLMQAIGLNFCFENWVKETLPTQRRIEMDFVAVQSVFERTSTQTDFSSLISVLHAGPKQRGTERKDFSFKDGSSGDVYRCVLLAMKADPPRLSFRYEDMLSRTAAQCVGNSPVGSSAAQALVQMDALAATVQEAPVIEWDENVPDIVEPYFLFFLRSSSYLNRVR